MPICFKHKEEIDSKFEACSSCLEEAALKCVDNFGPSEDFYCANCSGLYSKYDIEDHLKMCEVMDA